MTEELKNLGKYNSPEQMHKAYLDSISTQHPDLFDEKQLQQDFDNLFGVRYVSAGEYQDKSLVSLKPVGVNKMKDVADQEWVIITYAGEDIGYFENTQAGNQKLYEFLSYTVDHYLKEGEKAQLYAKIKEELATATISFQASELQRVIENLQPGRESPQEIKRRTKDARSMTKDMAEQGDAMNDLLAQQLQLLQEQFDLLNQKHEDLANTELQNQMNVLLDRVVKLRQALSLGKYSKKGSPEKIVITYVVDGTTIEQTADEVSNEIQALQQQIDQIYTTLYPQRSKPTSRAATTGNPSGNTSSASLGNKGGATDIAGNTINSIPVVSSLTPTNIPNTTDSQQGFDIFKFEYRDGNEAPRSYLIRSGVPQAHLDRFSDQDKGDLNSLKNATKHVDEFKRIAEQIQAIYLANPSLDIPPADVTTSPKAKDKEYKTIAQLYQKLQATDANIAADLSKTVKGQKFSYHLLDAKDTVWSDVLMAKRKDAYTWSRFSPDYGRGPNFPSSNDADLNRTLGASQDKTTKVELGKEGLVSRENLMAISFDQLITMNNLLKPEDMSIEAQTIRRAVLERLVVGGASAAERHDTGTIKRVPMEELMIALGEGNKETGVTRFRQLVKNVMMDGTFQQDLNVRYSKALKVSQALYADKLYQDKENYLHDYFAFPNPNQEDALLLNAFIYTLGKQIPMSGTELRYIFDMYKGSDGVLDPNEPASRIREIYTQLSPKHELGKASFGDTFMVQGVVGVINEGLTGLVEKNIISAKTAKTLSRFSSATVNFAKTGLLVAGVWHGIRAARYGLGGIKDRIMGNEKSESWKKAGGALKSAAIWGLGAREAVKFVQKPNEYWENSMIRDIYARFDPDLKDEIKQKQQIESGEIITEYTKRLALKDTIGSLSAGALISKKILLQGSGNNTIAIDMDAFVREFPIMEMHLQKEGGRTAVKGFLHELEQYMVNEYGLTWTKLQALQATNTPLDALFSETDRLKKQVEPMNTLLTRELGVTVTADSLMRLSDAEKQKYIERMAFAAQQLNKFIDKDVFLQYPMNPPGDSGTLWANMRKALDTPASVDGTLPFDGLKIGLKKFVEGTITEQQYFEGVRQVFADNAGFPIEKVDPADASKKIKDPLYVSPAPSGVVADFTTYLHDPKIGNAPKLGDPVYVATPTLGSTTFVNSVSAPFNPTTQSWKTDLYK